MNMSTLRASKLGIFFSIFLVMIMGIYTWQVFSLKMGLITTTALTLIVLFEYRTKLAEIRMAYKYENQ